MISVINDSVRMVLRPNMFIEAVVEDGGSTVLSTSIISKNNTLITNNFSHIPKF